MKNIAILGSTGSIGSNALKVLEANRDEYRIIHLSAYSNTDKLLKQALKFRPESVTIVKEELYPLVKEKLTPEGIEVFTGKQSLSEISAESHIDVILNAIVGSDGLVPTVSALKAGKTVALSNKESVVMAGSLLNKIMSDSGGKIYPVDSEHSAIWQCLRGENRADVSALILTGSGGPFLKRDLNTFSEITPEEALKHPNWSMGRKITIDSATMMNKGLEVIEARWLFDMPVDKIQTVIHPQSIIHSMVKFSDGSIKAQLGIPDMKIPIQYALSYPKRWQTEWENFSLHELPQITFEKTDFSRFPCLKLAFQALKAGGTAPTILNEINELSVHAFLNYKIRFTHIPELIRKALDEIEISPNLSLDAIQSARKKCRQWFLNAVKGFES